MSTYRIIGGDRQEYGPVSEEEVLQWIREGRANGETLAQAEGGMWKKLSLFPEFEGALSQALPPALPGSSPPAIPPPAVTAGVGDQDAKGTVLGPAIALLATGTMDLVMTLFGLLAGAMGWGAALFEGASRGGSRGPNPDVEEFIEYIVGPVGLAGNLFGLLVNVVILWAALRMMSLRNYGLCMVAGVLAVVPCTAPCCCLGIAAGIWALVVLSRPEIKQAFS